MILTSESMLVVKRTYCRHHDTHVDICRVVMANEFKSCKMACGWSVGSVGRLTWPRLNMSKIAELAQGQRVEVLRIDAQGTELGFLRSIRSATAAGRVRFIVAFAYHEAT